MTEDKPRPEERSEDHDATEAARPEAEAAAEGREPEESGAELEQERARAERNWEEVLRARAELDNLRKRNARDLEQARKFALERFIKDLLPVKDSLEQGLQAARDEGNADKLLEGNELTLRMLEKVLADHGVEEVNPDGQKFDPEHHEAMTMQPSTEHEPETVMMVLQKGYILNGRLVRPARVVVSRAAEGGGDA